MQSVRKVIYVIIAACVFVLKPSTVAFVKPALIRRLKDEGRSDVNMYKLKKMLPETCTRKQKDTSAKGYTVKNVLCQN